MCWAVTAIDKVFSIYLAPMSSVAKSSSARLLPTTVVQTGTSIMLPPLRSVICVRGHRLARWRLQEPMLSIIGGADVTFHFANPHPHNQVNSKANRSAIAAI